MNLSIGGDLEPSLGDGKKFRRPRTFLRKKFHFRGQNFWWPFYSLTMIFGFVLFSISLLPVMSYFTLSSQEKPLFFKTIPSQHLFYSVCAFARIRQTLLLKIFWGRMHGQSLPSQILGELSRQSPLGLRPWIYHNNNFKNVRLSCICCWAYFISFSIICA